MSLWHAPVHSQMPTNPIWRAYGPLVGVEHQQDGEAWALTFDRLERKADGYHRRRIGTYKGDELEVVVRAVLDLPGVLPRLALIAVLMGLPE